MEKLFITNERYRLELRWKKAVYDNEGICKLKGAYFSGPVLQYAAKIQDNDYIMLDFYSQYLVLTKNVYVAKLSWEEVEYKKDKVILKEAMISHDTELNRVPKLKNNDYIVIDTSNHEEHVHANHLVYKTKVVKKDNEIYNFRSK